MDYDNVDSGPEQSDGLPHVLEVRPYRRYNNFKKRTDVGLKKTRLD